MDGQISIGKSKSKSQSQFVLFLFFVHISIVSPSISPPFPFSLALLQLNCRHLHVLRFSYQDLHIDGTVMARIDIGMMIVHERDIQQHTEFFTLQFDDVVLLNLLWHMARLVPVLKFRLGMVGRTDMSIDLGSLGSILSVRRDVRSCERWCCLLVLLCGVAGLAVMFCEEVLSAWYYSHQFVEQTPRVATAH
ncbi:hypothetical protein Droror1_Dr00010060 [Drosera rotundifolia]